MRKTAKITDECIACGACSNACPVDAIAQKAGEDQYSVNPDICIFCETCLGICPVMAIIEEEVE